MLMVPKLRLVEPNNIYRKVPTRRPNAEMRTREYLTPAEVEKLIAAAKLGRHGHRDATLILVAFRHGLRAVEIADLEWSQVEWRHACGYALANAGHDTRLIQDWLGHRAIQHTARYTELSPTRFKDVWR